MKRKRLGFTLIELLAVIVVIVVVLAITVPIVSNMIETVRREAFKATAYSISDSGRFLMANDTKLGYEEFYYFDGVQYNATDLKLDYTGDGPKTGVVILNDNKKVAMAIHNGTYCATKSANTNKITVDKTIPEDCKAYNIINTCDTWEQIALKYDINLDDLLKENNVTDINSSTCGLNIKIPLTSTSSNNHYADGGKRVYYKTYYSVGYTTYSESFTSTSYEYTIKLGVLPLNIADIEVVRVTTESVFESLDDFKRYITKKNMGEVIWPGEVNPPEIDINQASVFKDHALRNTNMSADDVTVICDETECTASINITVNNMDNVSPNTINETPIAYLPVKFTVEFNGEADTCAVRSVTDAAPGTLAGTGTAADPYLIESIEDLAALSNNVAAGTTYSGKYIAFTNSFDFSNKRSYKDFSTTAYGDINGNGTVEGLQVELTTGAGFNPIGNGTTKFGGNVIGNANCIYDLYINRPTTSNVGFIGFQDNGQINTLSLNDVNITGGDSTGGIAGYVYNSSVNDISITGNVTGKNYVSMVVGYFQSSRESNKLSSIIIQGNVVGTNYVGGIVGRTQTYSGTNTITGIYKGGSITSSGTSVARIVGNIVNDYEGGQTLSSLSLSSITVNGSTVTSNSQTSTHGADITSLSELSDINLVEVGLDTHIGGDFDGNGYYWYGDASGNLVRKSVIDYPIVFTLSGLGTAVDPYLINSYDDLVQAQLNLGATYLMTTDIDMKDKPNFMLGSYLNPFRGTFEGNNKSINNFTLNLPQIGYVGFLGTSTGLINDLKFNNINITGVNYTGVLAGTSTGNIKAITMNNVLVNGANYTGSISGYSGGNIITSNFSNIEIKGKDYTGGLVGDLYNSSINDIVIDADVSGSTYVGMIVGYFHSSRESNKVSSIVFEGNVMGVNCIGGLVGRTQTYSATNTITGIYKSGSIVSTGTSVARVVGNIINDYEGGHILSSLAKSSITVNGSTVTSNSQTSTHGANIDSLSELSDINLVEVGVDTHIGGDFDGNGYYWYSDASGNLFRQKIADYPITFALTGAGTAADPYLISSYNDLVQAQLNLSAVYKLAANIDMTGKPNFMLGSYLNPFRGTFEGNNMSINNFTLNLPQIGYVGFLGTSTGPISNLNFNNINITGANYTGVLAGTSTGELKVLAMSNVLVNGANYTGGITGYSGGNLITSNFSNLEIVGKDYTGGLVGDLYNSSINDIVIDANVTAGNYVGMIVGYFHSSRESNKVSSIILEGNVSGANYVGGIVGRTQTYSATNTITGIYKGGSITSSGTSVARAVGNVINDYEGGHILSSLAKSSITVNGSTVTSNSQTSGHGANIDSLSELSDINLVEVGLDTHIGGDFDGNGYYWYSDASGNLFRQKIADYPITFALTGAGTTASPYLISNYSDLVQAQLNLNAVYKLATNIDMTGKPNFMLGSYLNPFRGTFEGNNMSINNFTLNLPQIGYVGFLGTSTGPISNLNFSNINITGANYTGVLAGTSTGEIKVLAMSNVLVNGANYTGSISGYSGGNIITSNFSNIDIVGKDYTGGLVGDLYNSSINDIVIDANVTGSTYVGMIVGYFHSSRESNKVSSIVFEGNVMGVNCIGGLVGRTQTYSATNTITGIYKGGSIVSTGTSVARAVGNVINDYEGGHILSSLAKSSITVNGSTVTSTSQTSGHGANITSLSELSDINLVEVGLDTHIGGDFDGNGYYWYSDASGNLFRQKIADYPLTFALTGAGTAASPYLISSYSDLVQAQLNLSAVYKLAANIDMTGKSNFMLGSYLNPFRGTFEGNNMSINNFTLNLPQIGYVGFLGTSTGPISNLNFSNVNITGANFTGVLTGTSTGAIKKITINNSNISGSSYTGGITGYTSGDIYGVKLENANIDGWDFTGGLVGDAYNVSMSNHSVNASITGNNVVGMIVGYFHSSRESNNVSSVVVDGDISGNNYVGGLVGRSQTYSATNTIKGVNKVNSINTVGTNVGRIIGHIINDYAGGHSLNASALSSMTVNGTLVTSTSSSSVNGLDITTSDLSNTITYTDRGFNFTDETLDYIWYLSGSTAMFREGNL